MNIPVISFNTVSKHLNFAKNNNYAYAFQGGKNQLTSDTVSFSHSLSESEIMKRLKETGRVTGNSFDEKFYTENIILSYTNPEFIKNPEDVVQLQKAALALIDAKRDDGEYMFSLSEICFIMAGFHWEGDKTVLLDDLIEVVRAKIQKHPRLTKYYTAYVSRIIYNAYSEDVERCKKLLKLCKVGKKINGSEIRLCDIENGTKGSKTLCSFSDKAINKAYSELVAGSLN